MKPVSVNQTRLFDVSVTELLEKFNLKPAIVTEWYQSGYLSFDPVVFDELEEEKEIEFEFVATLFTSGLSHKSVEHLLLNCEKPYRFPILSIYYNLFKKNWEILPTVPEYDIEEEIQNLMDSEEIEVLEEQRKIIDKFLVEYAEKLQSEIIIAIGDHQAGWEDDTNTPKDIADYLNIEPELVIKTQFSIKEDIFRGIGDICALNPYGWEQYELIKQERNNKN